MNNFDEKALTWDQNQNRVTLAKAVANTIKEHIHLPPNANALDFGCGTGLVSFNLHSYLKQITLVDSSSGMLEVLNEKITAAKINNMKTIKYNFATDPLLEERFNLIFSSMVLHHIDNLAKLFNVFFDLLKPGGVIALADLDKEDGSFHDPEFTGHSGFDRSDLEKIARQASFTDVIFKDIFTFVRPKPFGQTNFPIFLLLAKKDTNSLKDMDYL
jgi:ubiquinone/menaquinone biosynthesis C-methylase UbiE